MNGSLEPVHHRADHVHADAAPGDFGDFGGGAKAGFENEIESVLFAEALRFFSFDDDLFHGARAKKSKVDAAAIVADFDDDLSALMIGIEINGPARGLSGSQAFLGRAHTVIYGVANEVH